MVIMMKMKYWLAKLLNNFKIRKKYFFGTPCMFCLKNIQDMTVKNFHMIVWKDDITCVYSYKSEDHGMYTKLTP